MNDWEIRCLKIFRRDQRKILKMKRARIIGQEMLSILFQASISKWKIEIAEFTELLTTMKENSEILLDPKIQSREGAYEEAIEYRYKISKELEKISTQLEYKKLELSKIKEDQRTNLVEIIVIESQLKHGSSNVLPFRKMSNVS